MRNIITLKTLALLAIVFFSASTLANTIHSTTTGGKWNNESTWIGGVIPGQSDTAVIHGPVIIGHVIGYEIHHSVGGWVIVETGGSLQPHEYGGGLGTFILHVAHDFTNHGMIHCGTIPDDYEYLQLNINGNIYNDGSWRPEKTLLTGNGQHISQGQGSVFGGVWECTAPCDIYADSDLKFDCIFFTNNTNVMDFNLGGSTLHMGSHSLDATGTLIYNGTIEGNFFIKGRFAVNKSPADTLRFVGNVTVSDTLQNNEYGGGLGIQNLLIEGNLTNNGVIRDNNDQKNDDRLSILITGDIVNNGHWSCYYVKLVGEQEQSITQANGMVFDSYFSDLDSTSSIRANSDISILQDFNLGRATLYMENMMLRVEGWLYNGYIDNCLLKNAYIQNLTSLDALKIYGSVTCDDGNLFLNDVLVIDTLQSNVYGGGSKYFDLFVDGNFRNEGVVRDINPGDMLRLHISGNLENRGVWKNTETVLNGTQFQSLYQDQGCVFESKFINLESNNDLSTLTGDLGFSGDFDLGGAILDMKGKSLTMGGWLHNGILDHAKLHGGYLQYLDCINGLEVYDRVFVDDSVSFEGPVTIGDTLMPNAYGGGAKHYHLPVDGSVVNHGVIMDNYGGEYLFLYINGNITNNGQWVNHLTHVYVSNEQYIELIDDKPIESIVKFDAVVQSETYQWYYDDAILDSDDFDGETSQVLRWLVPVTSDWYGSFTCETGTKESVGILVKKGNLGIEEPVQEIDFAVYPNPCRDKISIRHSAPGTNVIPSGVEGQNSKLKIVDLYGRVVYEYKNSGVRESEIIVDVSHLPSGLYLVKLQTEDGVGVRKIIKL